MRLYIQQLDEQVRRLTGENERLTYQLGQQSGGTGVPAAGGAAPVLAPPQTSGALVPPSQAAPLGGPAPGVPAQSVAQDDPLVAPDGAGIDSGTQAGAPIDLSTLAAGVNPTPGGLAAPAPAGDPALPAAQGAPAAQTAGLPVAPPGQLGGNARDEYDAAYGYILTGDYDAAEKRFQAWLAAFPGDALAGDAQFWLAESYLQQGKAREAATAFLNLHKSNPQSSKAPDALMKLGMSLARLGETEAACATLAEVGLRYPNASATVASRVNDEIRRNKC